ncbi:MAG: hypothetical protein LBJ00_06625 [Planctomycetaceae bacterium]|nr:hypothetical protein [Planctomycetaceae bacterium]
MKPIAHNSFGIYRKFLHGKMLASDRERLLQNCLKQKNKIYTEAGMDTVLHPTGYGI